LLLKLSHYGMLSQSRKKLHWLFLQTFTRPSTLKTQLSPKNMNRPFLTRTLGCEAADSAPFHLRELRQNCIKGILVFNKNQYR